jgi:GNAT superfamily N-acetyltransferase
MSDGMVIRRAERDDVPAIEKCIEESYAKYIAIIGKKPMPMMEDYREVIRHATVYVLKCGDNLAGVLVLIDREEYVLLETIAVCPNFQGKSFGKKLLQFTEKYTKEQGKNEIRLYTNEKMYENISLYNHCGYIEYKREEEAGFNRVYFKKILT